MKPVHIPETKKNFISTIKFNKIYHILETGMLLSGKRYDKLSSEVRPDIVDSIILPESGWTSKPDIADSITLPGGYGWTPKPDEEIFSELKTVLAAKGYEPVFTALTENDI
jgi:hypothetical protein